MLIANARTNNSVGRVPV